MSTCRSSSDGIRLIATPKISEKIISGSISPSSARTADSNGLRGMSSTRMSLSGLAAAALA